MTAEVHMESNFAGLLKLIAAEHTNTVSQLNAKIDDLEAQLDRAKNGQLCDLVPDANNELCDSNAQQVRQSSRSSQAQEVRQSSRPSQQSNDESEHLPQQLHNETSIAVASKVHDQSGPFAEEDQTQTSEGESMVPLHPKKVTQEDIVNKIKKHMRTVSTHSLLEVPSSPSANSIRSFHWRPYLKKIMLSPLFEAAVGAIIVLNTLFMASETQYHGNNAGYKVGFRGMDVSAKEDWPGAFDVFQTSEKIFTIIYIVELLLRFAAFQAEFFKDGLNYLDLAVVVVSIVDWIFGAMTVNPAMIRFLRLAKLVRALRLMRIGRTFDSLHLLLQCLVSSLITLFWTCSLLAVIQMLVAMLLSQLTLPYVENEHNPADERKEVFAYYGTFTKSMLTTFEIMLANWSPACRVLVEHVSEWYSLFFLVYRCIIGFAVLNVINAVFIQTTLKVAQADKDVMIMQKQRAQEDFAQKLKSLFSELDASGDGLLELDEFKNMLSQPTIRAWMSALEIDPQDMEGLFLLIDDGNGQISLSEFMMGVSRIKGTAKSIDMAHTLAGLKRLEYKLTCLLGHVSTLSI